MAGILTKGITLSYSTTGTDYTVLTNLMEIPEIGNGEKEMIDVTVLTDDVNFVALKEKKAEMSVKEIESECAILYARKNLAQANFSKSNEGIMTAGIIKDEGKDGFVETRYGYIPIKR